MYEFFNVTKKYLTFDLMYYKCIASIYRQDLEMWALLKITLLNYY